MSAEDAAASAPQVAVPLEDRVSQPPVVTTKKMASSAIWRATETAGTELVALIVSTALARMLGPADFGAVALVTSIMVMLQALLYHGFTEALIQKPELTEQHSRSVLAANTAIAAALVVFGILAAWPLGYVLGRPEFPWILAVMLPSLMFRGLSSPMLASLRRDMDFRSIALRTLLGVIIGGAFAVTLAIRGAGYWALVVNQWTAEFVGFAVLALASPLKPWRMRWNKPALSDLTPVALPVMFSAFVSIAARRLDTVALGLFQPNSAVGIYSWVNRLVFAAQMVTQHGLSEVAMVVLSSMSQDTERYKRGVLRALRLMSFLCACAFGLLAVAGQWLVPMVFGEAWIPVTGPLKVAAALSLGGAITSIAGTTLVASGYATAFSRLTVGAAFAQLAAVAVTARWGLMAVAWGAGIVQCLTVAPALRLLSQHYGIRWTALVGEIAPIVVLFVTGLSFAEWVTTRFHTWYAQPLATGAFCALMGLGALILLRREQAERASMVPPSPDPSQLS